MLTLFLAMLFAGPVSNAVADMYLHELSAGITSASRNAVCST